MLTDVNFEPSNLCNANCIFCGYQFQGRAHESISDEVAHRIIDLARRSGVARLGITPLVGEPLVHRHLEAYIRRAAALPAGLAVGLTTNGILLTPARFRSLVAAGLTDLAISMTYPDENEYLRIYRSKKLRTVVANLDSILDDLDDAGRRLRVSIGVRTDRKTGWQDHPLFIKARARGWQLARNRFFDDWSGQTAPAMEREGLWTRPNRPKRLPCTMTYSGPHYFSDGRATACGCRDLDGKSELALDPMQLEADLHAVYETGAMVGLRERFRAGTAPEICQSCRHYNPAYEGEAIPARLTQLVGDLSHGVSSTVALFRTERANAQASDRSLNR